MERSQCIRASGIPYEYLSLLPGNNCHPIRPLAIISIQTCWFQVAGTFAASSELLMILFTAACLEWHLLTKMTTQPMGPQFIHFSTTRTAQMVPTERQTKAAHCNGNPDHFVVHPQTQGRNGKGIQPSSRLRSGYCSWC